MGAIGPETDFTIEEDWESGRYGMDFLSYTNFSDTKFFETETKLFSEAKFSETKTSKNWQKYRNWEVWKPKCQTLKDTTSQTMVWSAPHLIKNPNITNFWRLYDQTWATRVFPGVAGRR